MRPQLGSFTREILKLSSSATVDVDDHERAINRAFQVARRQAADQRRPSVLESLRGRSAPRSRDYLASALIGAVATPAVALVANLAARGVRNAALRRRLATSGERLFEQIKERGPLVGHTVSEPTLARPLLSYDDLAGKAVAGALTGSGVQLLRDRLSGSVRTRR